MKYFEEYRKCGCVSGMVKSKSDLLGYCEKHGTDRAKIHDVPNISIEQASAIKDSLDRELVGQLGVSGNLMETRQNMMRRGLENYPNTEEYNRFYKDNKIGMDG